MNWSSEPATESQLSRLGQFGYCADCSLTKGEAAYLIRILEQPETHTAGEQLGPKVDRHTEYALRLSIEHTRRAVAEATVDQLRRLENSLALATLKRRGFWTDSCRDPTQMERRSAAVLDLYRRFGCRFITPTHEQIQEILDALDTASPVWDRDNLEMFFQTLELNFPESVRRS